MQLRERGVCPGEIPAAEEPFGGDGIELAHDLHVGPEPRHGLRAPSGQVRVDALAIA